GRDPPDPFLEVHAAHGLGDDGEPVALVEHIQDLEQVGVPEWGDCPQLRGKTAREPLILRIFRLENLDADGTTRQSTAPAPGREEGTVVDSLIGFVATGGRRRRGGRSGLCLERHRSCRTAEAAGRPPGDAPLRVEPGPHRPRRYLIIPASPMSANSAAAWLSRCPSGSAWGGTSRLASSTCR